MRIKSLHIQNFRSIQDLRLDLDDTTIFIGANNSGKSSILEAVRIALSRRWGQRGTGFTENDVHKSEPDADPRTLPPIRVGLVFEEATPDEWPSDMVTALEEIVTVTAAGLNRISVSIVYSWSEEKDIFEPSWEFLNQEGQALPPRRRSINLSGFYEYVLFFWLGALRDAADEFTPRSRYWGGLLRAINVPAELEEEIAATLDDLDAKLLAADERFSQIADTIGRATEVASGDTPGSAKLRMLPLNLWDLLARAGIVLRNEERLPWLPLDHHGQGLQSLAVIFLFQAAIAQALNGDLEEGAEPIFAIEEPEVHLHPQAARTLWQRVSALPGQKLVTTHSPYFVQHVPLHHIRLVRFGGAGSIVSSIPRIVKSDIPWTSEIENLVNGRRWSTFARDESSGNINSISWFDQAIANDLSTCWRGSPDATTLSESLDRFRNECRVLVTEEEESELELLGRRMRGEIFFARRWILVEGQCEYQLLHAIGKAYEYDLDQHGVAVVDFQNNGNPSVYAGMAEALSIPWRMITDGDSEGEKFKAQLTKRGFSERELATKLDSLPTPHDLEDQLIADGHETLLRDILAGISGERMRTCPADEFSKCLKNRKTAYMSKLAPMVAFNSDLASRMPAPFIATIDALKTLRL